MPILHSQLFNSILHAWLVGTFKKTVLCPFFSYLNMEPFTSVKKYSDGDDDDKTKKNTQQTKHGTQNTCSFLLWSGRIWLKW